MTDPIPATPEATPATGGEIPQTVYVEPADPPAADPHPVTPATEDDDRPLTRKELEEWYASKNSSPTPAATASTAKAAAKPKPEPAKAASPAPKPPESPPAGSPSSDAPKSSGWFKGRPSK